MATTESKTYKMKVYVDGKFEDKITVRAAQHALVSAGYHITHDWTAEDESRVPEARVQRYWRECAEKDVEGVLSADAMIVLNHKELYGGMVEVGLALAERIPIIVIGRDVRNTVFWWLGGIFPVDTVEEAIKILDDLYTGSIVWPAVG